MTYLVFTPASCTSRWYLLGDLATPLYRRRRHSPSSPQQRPRPQQCPQPSTDPHRYSLVSYISSPLSNLDGSLRINRVRLRLIPPKPNDRELRLDLSRVHDHDTDPRRDQFLPEGIRERADSGLGSAVDRSASVGLASGDGADVDDVALPAACMEDLDDLLRQLPCGVSGVTRERGWRRSTPMSPITFVVIMMLTSSSAISPTLSIPLTNPLRPLNTLAVALAPRTRRERNRTHC